MVLTTHSFGGNGDEMPEDERKVRQLGLGAEAPAKAKSVKGMSKNSVKANAKPVAKPAKAGAHKGTTPRPPGKPRGRGR